MLECKYREERRPVCPVARCFQSQLLRARARLPRGHPLLSDLPLQRQLLRGPVAGLAGGVLHSRVLVWAVYGRHAGGWGIGAGG